MAWITPVDTEVLSAQSKERASISAIKGKDDLPQVLAEVVAEFRDAIAGRENALDADGTLPTGLAKYARDMALWIYITRGIPNNDGIQTKERADAAKKAEDVLADIRNGKIAIEPPTGWASNEPPTKNWNSENRLINRTSPVPTPAQQAPPPSPTNQPYANPNADGDI